ncbi:MAG: biopolymer transporter ExbD [Paracoccaceae bacterium]
MRLRRARRRTGGTGDEGVLPLINVVFLLLVFFMVAGRLTSADPFDIRPTRSTLEGPAPEDEPIVQVAADGRMALDGQPMQADALVDAVAARIAEGGVPKLRIKADAGTDTLALVALLTRLRAAGAAEARLMVEPGAE